MLLKSLWPVFLSLSVYAYHAWWSLSYNMDFLWRSSAVSSCCSFWLLVSDFRLSAAIISSVQIQPGTTVWILFPAPGCWEVRIIFLTSVLCVPQVSHVYMEMRELQQEVQLLRQRMNTFHLFMSLSHPVSITHVTLSHITKSQSPNGHISSAPWEFFWST